MRRILRETAFIFSIFALALSLVALTFPRIPALGEVALVLAIFIFGLSLTVFIGTYKDLIFPALVRIPTKTKLKFIIALAAVAVLFYLLELAGIDVRESTRVSLMAMTPLALAAAGECINQRAGVFNIGIEGIFLISCVIGVYGAEKLGGGVAGLLVGVLVGAFIGLVLGIISTYGKGVQAVAGMGINVAGMGLIAYLLMAIWAFPGIHLVRDEHLVPKVLTPLGLLSPIVFVALIVPIVAHIFLHRTLLGVRIKAAGEKPEAADVAGVNVNRTRIFTCMLGGALAGLGGVFMALGWFDGIVKEITAGRGFIALACVVVAGLQPLLALCTAFIFGFAEGLAYTVMVMPAIKQYPFLPYFFMMFPYIVVLVVVTIFLGWRRFPSALGKPYVRE